MVFTQQCEYDGSKMIQDMKNHMANPRFKTVTKGRGDMKIPLDQLDPFFTDLIVDNKLGTKILKAWVHYMEPGTETNGGHIHGTDTAVFYLQVKEGTGVLRLIDSDEIVVPKTNLFAVVPKGENHAITKNESDETRITLAFSFE
jgi:hypothetical protein